MSLLNLGKFAHCLGMYKDYCDKTLWTKNEISKFYFANFVNRRINTRTQSPQTIFEICRRIEEKDFYHKNSESRICGIRFLPGCGDAEFSEAMQFEDAGLITDLVFRNWSEPDLLRTSMSYNALSGWTGTLIPNRFMPVTSNQFRHTIAFLFDLELTIYGETDFDYFVHSQKHFLLTKKRLREFNLDSLYLREINEYLRIAYPKCVLKRSYDEHDWNWLTQDFHLFIYREVLGLDSIGGQRSYRGAANAGIVPNQAAFDIKSLLSIYVP